MKTELTKEVEQALVLATKADGVGVYGALEVTYVYNGYDLILKRRAKQKTVHLGKKVDLMYCMIRSLSRYTVKEVLKND